MTENIPGVFVIKERRYQIKNDFEVAVALILRCTRQLVIE